MYERLTKIHHIHCRALYSAGQWVLTVTTIMYPSSVTAAKRSALLRTLPISANQVAAGKIVPKQILMSEAESR